MYRIETGPKRGAGGFLCPPGHPMHTSGVYGYDNRGEMNESTSLEYAADCPWIPFRVRREAAAMLAAWQANRMPLESEPVQAWILQVLGYFRNCYRGNGAEPECWHAGKLNINASRDPMANVEAHAGVRLIRGYYPEFEPTAEHFANAKWGA
jgi:hypothetical protein